MRWCGEEKYMQSQREVLLIDDANRNFFKNAKAFRNGEKPKEFDVCSLMPDEDDYAVAEALAVHFNAISSEFQPLEPSDIPPAPRKVLPVLEPFQVAGRIRAFRKPRSMMRGDLFPCLVTKCADLLAVPFTDIFNSITVSRIWPLIWKREFVTVIPKKTVPTSFNDLRNISCTMLISKIYESYVLNWAMAEVKIKRNQFGGVKGCGAAHMMVEIWDRILNNLEDCRAATVLTSIDYSKAFNRLSFQHCLRTFRDHGASDPVIGLLATFLSNRTMSVRVGQSWSKERPVHGGVPQGSILGVFLFNVAVDNLETGCQDVEDGGEPDAGLSPVFEVVADPAAEACRFTSSPNDDLPPDFDLSPVRGAGDDRQRFVFLPNARNVGRQLGGPPGRDAVPVPSEPNPRTSAKWKPRKVAILKYVDDGVQLEAVNMETALPERREDSLFKIKHAIPSQNVFRYVVNNATAQGMKVNALKTQMLCVSDALGSTSEAYIVDTAGNEIRSGGGIKMLGFYLGQRPTVSVHVEALRRRFRQRAWILNHLKHSGFNKEELARVYRVIVRPVADYMAVVYHSMLSDREDEIIERLQSQAFKNYIRKGH